MGLKALERAPVASPRDDFDKRLAEARAKQREGEPRAGGGGSNSAWGYGFRIATELVGAILVGAAIGYGLDKWWGTSPWLLIVFLMLGFAAGIKNVLSATQKLDKELAHKK